MATITSRDQNKPNFAEPSGMPALAPASSPLGASVEQARHLEEKVVGTLLARAKLLRVRGQWDEAVSLCAEAMRRHPSSLTARSLLGEIYEAQTRLDDAAQWYAMALDVAPDSHKDRASLDRVLAAQRTNREQSLLGQAVLKDVPLYRPRSHAGERTLEWWDRTFPPGRSESIARMILAVSGAVTLLLMVSAGAIWFLLRNNRGQLASRFPQSTASGIPAPIFEPDPVVVQPPPPAAPAATPAPALPAPLASPASSVQRAVTGSPATGRLMDAKENLADNMRFSSLLAEQAGIAFRITEVQRDPNTRNVTLHIALPPMTESVENARERVIRASVRVARAASLLDRSLVSASVSVSVPPASSGGSFTDRITAPAPSATPAFVGEVSLAPLRPAASDISDTAPAADLLMRFRRTQWSDTLSAVQP